MKIPHPSLVITMLFFITASCAAQTVSPVESSMKRVGQPAEATKVPKAAIGDVPALSAAPAIETQPMPGSGIDRSNLEQVLELIHKTYPDFNSVVVRAPGIPPEYPAIPAMSFKNVTIGQFLQFIQVSFSGVACYRIDGQAGPLYTVRVQPDTMTSRGITTINGGALANQKQVHLYRLTEIINNLTDENTPKDSKDSKDNKDTDRPSRVKAATDEVLSLLQAALDQTDPDGPCVLKMHDPTLTLLFKGSLTKQTVLEDALASLGGGVRSPRGFIPGRGITFGGGGTSGTTSSLSSAEDANQQASLMYQDALIQREATINALQQQLAQMNKSLTTRPTKD